MATISRHGNGWRAQIRRKGQRPLSATFPLKKQAELWAAQREAERVNRRLGILPEHTLGEALRKFRIEVTPSRNGKRWEVTRLKLLERDPIASQSLSTLDETHLAEWRDRSLARTYRGKRIQGTTVRREMSLLAAVFSIAVSEWKWLAASPLKSVKKPPTKPGRRRGLRQAEIDGMTQSLGYMPGTPLTASSEVAVAFLLAVETGMRSGELLNLTWPDVHEKYVHLPKTKNGDARDVSLSSRARELIEALRGRDKHRVFTVTDEARDRLFRDARDAAGLSGFTFHDSRSEAISRLSKKLEPLALAKMVGQRDLRSLMIYYTDDPTEVADRLG